MFYGTSAAITPNQALSFFYTNTLRLMSYDLDDNPDWAPRGRFWVEDANDNGDWINRTELFDYTTGALTGAGADTASSTVFIIAMGPDDYADAPGGNEKEFSNMVLARTSGGTINLAVPTYFGWYLPDGKDHGDGWGIFHVNTNVTDVNNVMITMSKDSRDDANVYHTALFPGKWKFGFQQTVAVDVVGQGLWPTVPVPGTQVTRYREWTVTMPPASFLLYNFASDLGYDVFSLNGGGYVWQYSVIPAGVQVAYGRVAVADGVTEDFMLVNPTTSSRQVHIRVPAEYRYTTTDPESGTSSEGLASMSVRPSIYVFIAETSFGG